MANCRKTWFDEGRTHFEYIVIGCGGIGSAAVYWLSKRAKADVLGIEQFELGHHNGGSQDHSRIIRLTYHDDRYTKIARHTFETWEEVEKEAGVQLVYKCGGLNMSKKGEADGIMECYAKAMDDQNIKYERLDADQLHKKFPQFEVDKDVISLYQPEAGLVDAALSNSVHQQLARGYGASIISNCPVVRVYRNNKGQVAVQTTKGTFTCRRLVVTAGAWINQILGSIGVHIPVTVTQEQVTYLGTPHIKEFTKDRFPMFVYHSPLYDIYQIPVHGNSATKIGIDAGGRQVTANTRSFKPNEENERAVIEFMEKLAPKFVGPVIQTKTCLYTMTPDRHFVVDKCEKAGFPDIIICNGAGHAFKFACLLGKILSEMAIDGKTQYDVSGFSMEREAITNPEFKPTFQMAGLGLDKYPMFLYHAKDYDFYQIPIHGNSCSKIGVDAGGPPTTGNTRNYIPDPVREKAVIDFMETISPKFIGPVMYTKTCLYTMTPDRHFVVDKCEKAGFPDIIICNGAGHAFKFACLLGKILSQLAIDGKTQYDISGFSMNREAITNPDYEVEYQWAKHKAAKNQASAKL